MSRSVYYYLIVRSDGEARLTKRAPRHVASDEVGKLLRINLPDTPWGRVTSNTLHPDLEMTIDAPEPPTMEIERGVALEPGDGTSDE